MQLELGVEGDPARERAGGEARGGPPRVLALCVPDLPLQRVLRARAAVGSEVGVRAPLAVEREGRVVACDAEARARGVRPGDALVQARAACAELETVAVDDGEDRAVLEGLAEALLALAPAVEIAWPDGLLADASGARLLAEGGDDGEAVLADRAVALAADLGLRCRAAVADGRAPARALARHGAAHAPVAHGASAAALAGLPLAALDLAPPLASRLVALGLREVGELARLPADALAHRLGASGLAAWRLAQGDDPSPLVPYVPSRLPEERLDLEAPVESSETLLFALKRLCDRVAARLAGRGLGATRLAVALALDPRGEERLEISLALPSSAASRWLLVLRERLGALRLPGPVVAAVLGVAEAAPAPIEQLAIGERPEQLAALEVVLARLAARLGDAAVFAAQQVDRHRPEAAYRADAFGGRRRGGKGGKGARNGRQPRTTSTLGEDASPPPSALVRPTRLLARPQPLVALGEGGRLTAVRAGGRTLRVVSLSPAERLAGEWWADPFDRDYHRARIEGLGDCWIFRDAGDGRLWLHGFFD
ncbi:MAG TPA: DNA polymerase Y family protein [Anaeromyxobacteraceae bacterium]